MKDVLILAHVYYPNAYMASHRMAKLAKYLPKYGWNPRVVSAEWTAENCDMFDGELLTPGTRSSLLKTLPNEVTFWGRIKEALLHPKIGLQRVKARYIPAAGYTSPAAYYCHALVYVREYVKENRPTCILASFPPGATLAVADVISREFGIPWVADFRDTYDVLTLEDDSARRRRLLALEPLVTASSSAVITVSEGMQANLVSRGNLPVHVLHNGFDPEDYAEVQPEVAPEFRIVYTGTIYYPQRDPKPLFQALSRLVQEGAVDAAHISVDFFGRRSDELARLLAQFLALTRLVKVHGPVPHRRAIAVQKGAEILLHLSHPGERGVLTGKIYEYLAARRPIMTIPGDDDAVDELLERSGAGVSLTDPDAIGSQIHCWYVEWCRTGTVRYRGVEDVVAQYSRDQQAEQLSRVLEEAAEQGSQSRRTDS